MVMRLLHYVYLRKRIVIWVALALAAATIVYGLITGPRYETQAMLMPPLNEGGEGILAAWMARLELPSMIAPMSAGRTTAAVMADILESHRLASMLVDSLDLMDWYGIDSMDEAIKELRGATGIQTSETGIIMISVKDKSPEMSVRIAGLYIAGLDSLNRRLEFTRAGNTMRFIEGQLERYGRELEKTRFRISEFQKKNGVVDFEQQIEGAIDVAVNLKIQQVIAEINMELLDEYAREGALELRRKRAEYEKITAQLESMVKGGDSSAVFIPFERLPELKQEYASLQRDLEVLERVYSFLMERYEESGIEKARTTPSVQVVDYPYLPEKPAGLPLWLLALIVAAIGFVWISAVLAGCGWLDLREKNQREEEAYRSLLELIRRDISRIRRLLRI